MTNGANRAERRRQWTPAHELTAAVEHHQSGRLDRAEAVYRKVLQRDPSNVDALHLLGLAALNRGNPERAIQLIGRALAIAPNLAEAYINLGNAQRVAGHGASAVASYRRAIGLKPDLWDAHNNLALTLGEQGDFAGALTHAERARELNSDHPDVLSNLASTLRALGNLATAETIAQRAAQLAPDRADLHLNLANVLADLHRFDEATASYRRAIELTPRFAAAHYGLGRASYVAGDMQAAVKAYRAALALDGDQAVIWNDLGRAMRALGQFEEAITAFQRALVIRPDFADAHRNLALCQRLPTDNAQVAHVQALVADANLPAHERITAGFALAKMLDDADRFEEAFAVLDRANTAYRAARAAVGERFDADALRRQVNATIARYTPTFFASVAGWGNPSELPVYIIGMPRSGTSLVEQIAASHSSVFGAGERKDIGEIAGQLGEAAQDWHRDNVRQLADVQLTRLETLGSGATRVIDKLPDNVFMLGIIATLFPSARIIVCTRDPRDIGLSCYFQKFADGQLMFSYSLADCGARHRETARLIAHWRDVLPLRMLEISYEKLVADLEGESRRLVSFLGLDWEPAYLAFHQTQRTVQTASGWQVRQPLYGSSVGRWRCYERHLRPLFAALEVDASREGGLAT
jgi:tetratricopeptide (TPR) repeat protein